MKAYPTSLPETCDDNAMHGYGTGKRARARYLLGCLALAMSVAVPCGALSAAGAEPIDLGSSADFGALAGAAISGTGHVKGDVGSGAGAIAPAITSTGTIHPTGHAAVMSAIADFAAAYDDGMSRTPDVVLSAAAYELGGTTLTPGVHKIGAAATLASPMTFDAEGDPDAVFIIQISGALGTTAGTGNVVLTNDARGANVFWIVGGAVSMGAGTHMEGNLLGGAAIALGATTTVNGRVMAGTAAGTIALSTIISVPVDPSVVGGRVWFDSNDNGIRDPAETTGFPGVPTSLLRLVLESSTIDLGTAAHFGALAGGAISGSGNVEGDVGSGTGAIAPAVTSDGAVYPTGHAAVMTAIADFATAYNGGKSRIPDVVLSAAAYELGGSTLAPGVHKIGAAGTLASPMTFDAAGNPGAVFIVQIAGAFGTTAATGNVILKNEAKSANVFWIVEGAVSIGADSRMEGNILGGAAITFGAGSTISGRALAGTAAGTIALANTVSAATGTPPVGFPPPFVVANTATDASGHYLFEGVEPGTYIVRWDLSGVTTDFRITAANQGGDDSLDSDGVTGEVGGSVDAMEIVVVGGSTNLNTDLGLVETLPAIKAAAKDELATALVAFLLANSYTPEGWTALMVARTDGDMAIDAASDAFGVAAAKTSALAAMDAVQTFAEALAAAKATALDDLSTALDTHLQADYSAENRTQLNAAKTDGDTAIQAATDTAGVAAARESALAAIDAVPTVAETLAAAKAAALEDLAAALAANLAENYYTPENWATLINASTDGEVAINAATDTAGVTTAADTALAVMDAVPTVPDVPTDAETPVITDISRTTEGEVTLALRITPNVRIALETSTDLKDWTAIATATPGSEVWSFVHHATLATGSKRFYRAFLTPLGEGVAHP